MKKLSFAVAMIAAVSLVVTPVAPAFAQKDDSRYLPAVQQAALTKSEARQKIVAHAERGEAAILSKAQVDQLARTNPKLHAKLMTAYNSGTVPSLTPAEKKMLVATTKSNLAQYKAAGDPLSLGAGIGVAHAAAISALGWFVIGFIGLAVLLILLYWFAPQLFRSPRMS
jgi:hypothetical protein